MKSFFGSYKVGYPEIRDGDDWCAPEIKIRQVGDKWHCWLANTPFEAVEDSKERCVAELANILNAIVYDMDLLAKSFDRSPYKGR